MIKKIIKEGKEALVTKWLNSKIDDYGKIIELQINKDEKLVSAEILLKGESETYKICFCDYALLKYDETSYIYVDKIKTGREWLDLLLLNHLQELLPGKKVELPNNLVKKIIKLLL